MVAKLPDRPTLAGLGAIVYTAGALAHEGLGHGGTCIAVGGRILALTSTYLQCSEGLSPMASQAIEAAGTLVNLALALSAFVLLRTLKGLSSWARVFWWLFATVNGLQGGGYLMVSPLGQFGDWHAFVGEAPAQWEWPLRISLTVLGAGLSLWVAMASARVAATLIGKDEQRVSRLIRLAWVPYVAGCSIDLLASFLNPIGWRIVLVSSIGSAVFGTCWLVFVVPSIARRRTAPSDDPFPHDELSRSPGWLMVAVIFSAVHLWFGRGFQTPG